MAIHSAWLQPTGQSRVDTRLATVGTVPTGVLTSRPGIVPDGGFGLQSAAPMQCQIMPGRAFVQGITAQGGYQIASDTPVALTVPDGDPQYPRVDLVVVQVQDQEFDTSGQTQASVVLIEGTPSASPAAPALPPSSLALFQISVPSKISAGTTLNGVTGVAWSTAVTDLRVYTTGLGGILPAGTTSWTPPMAGQYADLNGELRRWNGTAWTPVFDPIATGGNLPQVTSTARPAGSPAGKLVYETDSGAVALYSGGSWQHRPGVISRQSFAYATTFVTFAGIPQVYRDLRLVISARSSDTTNSGFSPLFVRFNNDTGTNYNYNQYGVVQGATAATVTDAWGVSAAQCGGIWNSFFSTPGRGVMTIDIPNYADTNNVKVFLGTSSATDGGASGALQTFCGGWNNSAGISSITLALSTAVYTQVHPGVAGEYAVIGLGPSFLADSTFTLYGLG